MKRWHKLFVPVQSEFLFMKFNLYAIQKATKSRQGLGEENVWKMEN